MHRGILLSFYSSAAGFVNGKCACFLPGFLGRAQKSPGRGRTIWNARRVRFAHIQRKNYFYFAFVALCGALQTHFHGKGRNGKRHTLPLAPCGSIHVSIKTCCCPYVSPRSDFKSAEHKKSSSAAAWIFCMEPNSFGVTRGEQPLVRASRASKVAETLPR